MCVYYDEGAELAKLTQTVVYVSVCVLPQNKSEITVEYFYKVPVPSFVFLAKVLLPPRVKTWK